MKFKVCPWCGSHLDYGERCDCTDKAGQEGGAQSAKADQAGKRKPRLLDQKTGQHVHSIHDVHKRRFGGCFPVPYVYVWGRRLETGV